MDIDVSLDSLIEQRNVKKKVGNKGGKEGKTTRSNRRPAPYQTKRRGANGSRVINGASVYVGNLSWDVSWQDLKDHFKSAGNVLHADVMTGPDGRSKGYGIVTFSSAQDTEIAISTLNDTELNGRAIFVREDRERGGDNGSRVTDGVCAAYVGNLSWDVSWQDLKDHFKSAGVLHADVMTGPDGRSKGYGIVTFASAQDTETAISTLNDTELNGRTIFVREDRERSGDNGSRERPRGDNGSRVTNGVSAYVGNLSWDVSWQDLKDHFKSAGNVLHADVMTGPDGRSKGYGIVTFASAQDTETAISTLNDTELNGRTIFVREDREA